MPVADLRKVKGLAGDDLGWWCNNHHQPDGPAGIGAAVDRIGELLGESPGIQAVREKLARLLQLQSGSRALPPILIQGETGTSKGLLARAIHRAGPRAAAPFIDVNCAAIPETLLEAEMFGFERGAFTDAKQAKAGLFQAAHGGTIFLDEVGLLSEALHIATQADFALAIGSAQQALGRTAHARGDLETSATRLASALATFTGIRCRYECARTRLDLALVARSGNDPEAAQRHLNEAHRLFAELGAPRYRERLEHLAADWRIPLGNRDPS